MNYKPYQEPLQAAFKAIKIVLILGLIAAGCVLLYTWREVWAYNEAVEKETWKVRIENPDLSRQEAREIAKPRIPVPWLFRDELKPSEKQEKKQEVIDNSSSPPATNKSDLFKNVPYSQ